MSKFSERIRKAQRFQPQPLGFVTARSAAQATMVLAALAPDAAAAAELARRGADVVIVGTPDAPARPEPPGDIGQAIAGAWVAGSGDDEAKRLREAGYDFVVFDPDRASAAALLDDSVGYVLRLPDDLSDLEVRALEGFRLDAIDIGMLGGPLTVRRQIDLRRLHTLTRKPLMAAVRADISPPELRVLRDTNVTVVAAADGDAVAALRARIDALPERTRRKDEGERMTPFVPHAASGAGEADEHDHDDDE